MLACPRSRWSIENGTITVGESRLVVVPTPPDAVATYDRILQHVQLQCRPHLVWVRDCSPHSGLYLGDMIVVGATDVERIAMQMMQAQLTPRFRWVSAHGHSFHEFKRAARDHLIAHEVGHALGLCDKSRHGSPACEGRADMIAGRIASRMGWCEALGQLFFHAIGCPNAPACSHPSSEARVDFFVTGRTAERTASGWR